MERRELIKSLLAIPATTLAIEGAHDAARLLKVEQNSKYIVFIDPTIVDVEAFCRDCHELPPGTPVHCIHEPGALDDAIRIFKVSD